MTLLLATVALAAPDLSTSITAPSGTYVYATGRYTVTVRNTGAHTASSVSLSIQLPETNTSPSVHVLGTLGATSASCTQTGTQLSCSLGSIRKSRSTSVYFDIALPESSEPIEITATASTSGETNTGNNAATHTASLVSWDVSFSAPVNLENRHCTGTALTSFFECELYPSSISSHTTTLNADGSLTIADVGPEYTGTWTSTGADHLAFTYYEYGTVIAEFEGWGVDTGCWEGLTTFPGSAYVSPYEVCVE